MRLRSYFNKKYAFQNIKKSKGVLAFFLGIVPLFSTLYLFSVLTSSTDPLDLTAVSFPTIIGAYIIPLVVSLCLFGYIFKKKSVDFTCSMPISRKTIFITNTVTGILLLVGMLLINALFIELVGLVTSSIIPFTMILDYLLVWIITYIFVFILFNVGISFAGNSITALIISLILFFVAPYLVEYTTGNNTLSPVDYYTENTLQIECKDDACLPENYECYGDITCLQDAQNHRYNVYNTQLIQPTNHPLPYNMIKNVITYPYKLVLYNPISLIKMALGIIVGFIVGYILFLHRKMENNETSFKSEKLHVLVKGLLITPVLFLIYPAFREHVDTLGILIFAIIIIGYYYLYDLVTRKSIGNFLRTSINLVCTIVVVFGIAFLIDEVKKEETFLLESDKIDYIEFKDMDLSMSASQYPKITDQELIDEIVKQTITKYPDYGSDSSRTGIVVKMDSGKEIEYTMAVPDAVYADMTEKIKNSKDYAQFKDLEKNNLFAYRFGNIRRSRKADDEIKKIIQEAFDNAINHQLNEASKYSTITFFYYYDQGNVYMYQLSSNASPELEALLEEEITAKNKKIAKNLDKKEFTDTTPYLNSSGSFLPKDSQYLVNTMQDEIKSFIRKYSDDKFDTAKDYIVFDYYTGAENAFTTNRVSEFLALLEEKRTSLKGDKDYEEWLKQNQIILEDTSEVEAETNVVD
jgi:membrane protein